MGNIDLFSIEKAELDFTSFKNRLVKAKEIFNLKEISKNTAYEFIKDNHYLGSAKFFAKFSYGLYSKGVLVGVSTYSNPQGISTLKGWFSVDNKNQDFLELSRLCVLPNLNGTNATSYLLSNSMKKLKSNKVKAVITLADNNRHSGSIYQVCNFKYYGLTSKKSDFYSESGLLNPRGATKGIKGVWLTRNRKHRYCYKLDKSVKVNYIEQDRPLKKEAETICSCDNSIVFDNRFKETYVCPRCHDFKSFGLMNIMNIPDNV